MTTMESSYTGLSKNRDYNTTILTQKYCSNCAYDKGYYCQRRELNLNGLIKSQGCDLYYPKK